MFEMLEKINKRPEAFQFYTTDDLWTDEHTSKQMLSFHLNSDVDASSRNIGFINRSVDWIVEKFRIGKGFRVVDFGCGPGLYTTALAKHGADVTGIDFSSGSIEYAKDVAARENLKINYINRNYLEFETLEFETDERFDLTTMIMCDFCALSPVQRKVILGIFHKILKPGGSVLLDVYSMLAFEQREEAAIYEKNQLSGFWAPGEYYGFLNIFKYSKEKVVLDKYTIIEPDRTREVYNWLQYFSPEELEQEFTEAGFEVKALYSDVAGSEYDRNSSEFAVVAEKV